MPGDARLARSETWKQRRGSDSTQGRLSANSVDGEYWGEHDLDWAKGSLTAEKSMRESSSESAAKKRDQRESSLRQSFFQAQKFQQYQERLPDDLKAEVREINKLRLQMKLPLKGMLPRHQRLEDRAGSGVDRKDACFGYITWGSVDSPAVSSTNLSRYACFKDDTDPSDVFKLLECWKLKPPSVLMSVTGSAQELNLEHKIQSDFEKGFAHAVSCTDAWVITGGTDTGVMKMVGSALSKQQASTRALKDGEDPPPVIGVVPFGAVMQRAALYKKKVRLAIDRLEEASRRIEREQKSPLISEKTANEKTAKAMQQSAQAKRSLSFEQASSDEGEDEGEDPDDEQQVLDALEELKIAYRKEGKNSRYEAGLDRGHSHFLLVDDGKKGRYEDEPLTQAWYSEIELRTSLEKKICEHYKVPGVQVVLQGSYGTLRTIKSAIDQERQVVLIKDSGGAAHVLAAIIEPLLERANELPSEHAVFRRKAVQKRITAYRTEAKDSQELKQMVRSAPTTKDGSGRQDEMWQEVEDICVHFEKITSFSFANHVAKMAGRKPVQGKPFDQVLLDAIVQACKLEKEHEEKVAATRRSPLGPMRPSGHPLHEKSRGKYPAYPQRIPVPDDKVKWDTPWPDYSFKVKWHCDESVKQHARLNIDDDFDADHWADPPRGHDGKLLPQLREQLEDRWTFCETPHFEGRVTRRIRATNIGFDEATNAPLNPRGRTGIAGRGLLGRWGPNHAADCIITRFSPHDGKLQFVAIQRNEINAWAIPGGIVDIVGQDAPQEQDAPQKQEVPQKVFDLLKRSSKEGAPEDVEDRAYMVQKLFASGTTVYCGYVDDPRNTVRARAASRIPQSSRTFRLVAHLPLTRRVLLPSLISSLCAPPCYSGQCMARNDCEALPLQRAAGARSP